MAYTLQNNTPSAGYIQWSNVHIVFDGLDYAVTNGNTNKKFVYWTKASPGAFQTSDTYPTLGADDAIVFINKAGIAISILDAAITDGSLIVPGTIVAGALAADAVTANNIKAGEINTDHLSASAVTADKVSVINLAAISANLGSVTAGDLTLDTTGFVRGGQTGYRTGTGFWQGYNGSTYKMSYKGSSGVEFYFDGAGIVLTDKNGNTILSSGTTGTAYATAIDNSQQQWSQVSGTGKPADNATVGADSTNLKTGRGVNLLHNAGMTLSATGFFAYNGDGTSSLGLNLANWALKDGGARYGTYWMASGATTNQGAFYIHSPHWVPVIPGRRYEAYAYTGAHRCYCNITIDFWDVNGVSLGNGSGVSYVNGGANNAEAAGGKQLTNYKQIGTFATAPAGAAFARFVVWKGATLAGNNDSYMFVTLPYFGEATAGQTELSPWAEGSSDINTKIDSSNASTYIANAAIGAAQIGSLSLVGTSNFNVKSATVGARVEMDNKVIKVFDASGNLRVQIGDLLA